jgi:hypothetical protein
MQSVDPQIKIHLSQPQLLEQSSLASSKYAIDDWLIRWDNKMEKTKREREFSKKRKILEF